MEKYFQGGLVYLVRDKFKAQGRISLIFTLFYYKNTGFRAYPPNRLIFFYFCVPFLRIGEVPEWPKGAVC
jgi:hypothetical protein